MALCRLKQRQITILNSLTGVCVIFLFFVLSEEKGKRIRLLVNNPSEKLFTSNEVVEGNILSFCSLEADRRGPHQNVIAYSLYGNFSNPKHFSRYVDPSMNLILGNISQAYPGWIMRVYTPLGHDDQLSYFKLKEFFGKFSFVDLCNVTQVFEVHNITRPIFPMTWRFLPLMDPLVDRILSRDSDTIISKREVTAVRQWLNNSTATFHLMRDHQLHCAPSRTFLGGLWGAKTFQNRQFITAASFKMYYETEHEMKYGFDQGLLHRLFWPLAINDSMAHDSYCCELFTKGSYPFLTRREGNEHVGRPVNQKVITRPTPKSCPEKCRPPDHLDWDKC